jgi:cytochrome c oxidase cbb3-type subunit 4
MEINLIRTIVTVASFVAFLAIVAWALHGRNRKGFEEAGQMVIEDDS